MPALLLHLTLAKETAARGDAPAELAAALQAQRPALLLGSILPDLPYHARFAQQLARHLLRREYLLTEWGDLWHTRGTGQLAIAMIEHAVRHQLAGVEREQVLALVAGYLSHHAVDRVVHPVINQLVQRHRLPREPVVVIHARLERYQSLFYHLDRVGFDIAGTPLPRQMVREVAGSGLLHPMLPSSLWLALRAATLEVHGRTPDPSQLRDWLWGVTAYGHLFGSPAGRLERLRGDRGALRTTFYQGPAVDLAAPLQQAMDLTIDYWHAALDVVNADRINGEVRTAFLQHVPDVDFSTGA
jgi:hypothetical protein